MISDKVNADVALVGVVLSLVLSLVLAWVVGHIRTEQLDHKRLFQATLQGDNQYVAELDERLDSLEEASRDYKIAARREEVVAKWEGKCIVPTSAGMYCHGFLVVNVDCDLICEPLDPKDTAPLWSAKRYGSYGQ